MRPLWSGYYILGFLFGKMSNRDTQDKLMYSIASKLCIQPSENAPRDIFYQILLKGLDQLGGATHG